MAEKDVGVPMETEEAGLEFSPRAQPQYNALEHIRKFKELMEASFYSEILKSIRKGEKFFVIPFPELSKFDPDLANDLLDNPEEVIKAAELAVQQFDLGMENGLPLFIRIRFSDLPASQGVMIRNIRSVHLNKFVVLEGVVRQKSDVRPQVTTSKFECPACGNVINVLQLDTTFREPSKCGCGRKGKFLMLSNELVDAQGIVIEESPEVLEGGEQPKRVNVFLKDDLVSPLSERRTSPGSKVVVNGIVKEVPILSRTGAKMTRFDLLIEANFVGSSQESFYEVDLNEQDIVQIKEIAEDPRGYEKIISSIAPSIYGYEKIKEALLLQMLGGVRKVRNDKVVSRGDMHILLVGDPGAGKSQLLKRVATIAPKSRYVSGKGASGAGLTASVVRDEFLKGWALEAGALVLASDGICCIDELDKMGVEDRAAMHEALEQQCYHYDTIITLANGEEKVIGKLVEELLQQNSSQVIQGKDCLVLPIGHLGIEMLTTDWKDIFPIKINRISKHIAPSHYIKIQIGNGRSVIVTPEHPFFSINDGKIITKRADEVIEGDWTPVPLIAPIEGERQFFGVNTEKLYNSRALKHILIPKGNCEEFFKIVGYLAAEGSKERNRGKLIGINFTNKDPLLLEDFSQCMQYLFGIAPYKQERKDHHDARWMLRYISTELAEFFRKNCPGLLELAAKKELPQIVMRGEKRNVAAMLRCLFEGDGHVSKKTRTIRIGYASNSERLVHQVQDLLLRFAIRSNLTLHEGSYKVGITGYDNIKRFREYIGFVTKNGKIDEYLRQKSPIRTVKDLIPTIALEVISLLRKYKIGQIGNYKTYDMEYDHCRRGFDFSRKQLQKIVLELEQKIGEEDNAAFSRLKGYAFGSIGFEQVRSVERIEDRDQKWSYDVTIEPNHTFISQNMVLHNTVSVSKANVQATLIARATVLAAANPKFGRFDPFDIIANQIDLPPTLINRFDLIFPIKDIPDEVRDEKLAAHILGLHQNPEIQNTDISTDLLKKYIAYARQFVRPRLTPESIEEIKSFYLKMRVSGSGEGSIKTIPISARQLEALVRMAEASAKSRLSDVVLRRDARKAIELLEYCLLQVGFDKETGKIDIDRIATGVGASQRNTILIVKEILNDLEIKMGKTIPIESIVQEAKNRGLESDKVEEAIEKLRRTGDIFEPRRGFISRL